jgi:hypothetical protein
MTSFFVAIVRQAKIFSLYLVVSTISYVIIKLRYWFMTFLTVFGLSAQITHAC